MTNAEILRELQIINKRHFGRQPSIAIDSLVLALQLKRTEILPNLIELDVAGFIKLNENTVTITDVGIEAIT